MLSLACKRTGLRKPATSFATSSVRRQRQQHQRARLTTTASASASKQQQQQLKNNPLVISRRAWLDFKESRGMNKKRPDASKQQSKSNDEKPWPRNMQIAGYVAGVLTVPYMILWTITSNPTLREWFGPYIPLEKLRSHYGKLEWDAQSYSEEMEEARKKEKNEDISSSDSSEKSLIGYYQFPEEAPFHERRQQEIVEAMEESDVAVTISLSSTSSSSSAPVEEIVTKTMAAKTIANTKNLLEFFPSASASKNTTVAVDFSDQNNQNDSDSDDNNVDVSSGSDGALTTDAESMANENSYYKGPPVSDFSSSSSSVSRLLAMKTQTMSTWAYVPQQQQQTSGEASQQKTTVTDAEMRMGRLEYDISEVEKSLRDPMCTRSIDDMTTELRQAKRELSRLKWKRRFGLSR